MDGSQLTVSALDLYTCLGTASAPVLIDVRRHDSFLADDRLIIGAYHRAPADVEHWRTELPAEKRKRSARCSRAFRLLTLLFWKSNDVSLFAGDTICRAHHR